MTSALTKGGHEWLVEVKVVYKGDATTAVRAVVGQLLQYRHFFYTDKPNPSLVGVFNEPIGDAYIAFLEELGIRSVWREDGKWSGSESAHHDTLVPKSV